jgi:GT2 family glycosyltransferase
MHTNSETLDPASVRIGVVIPNWNGGEHFRRCLESLAAQLGAAFPVIIVDNDSRDDSWKFVQTILPAAELVRLDRNYGFGYAVNRGIETLRTDWVLLLNNDVVLDTNFLEELRRAVAGDSGIDIVATKLLLADRPELLDGVGDALLMGGGAYRLAHGQRDGERFCQRRDVFGACAAAALYRRSLLEELGRVDADFFAYLEDVDLSLRARWAGYRCVFVPEAIARHEGSTSLGGELAGPIMHLITRNQLLLVAKNYPPPLLIRLLPRILWYQFLWLGFSMKRGAMGAWILGMLEGLKRLPGAFRKQGRLIRRRSWRDVLSELARSEASIFELSREPGSRSNTLLRYYFWLFRPRAATGPRLDEA